MDHRSTAMGVAKAQPGRLPGACPHRLESVEMSAAYDQCLFCNIAAGYEDTAMVREEEQFIAFHDLFPKAEKHILVIPREHHENLDAFVNTGGDAAAMMRFVASVAQQLGVSGRYRLITNVGADVGQVIPHLHWHLLAGQGADNL